MVSVSIFFWNYRLVANPKSCQIIFRYIYKKRILNIDDSSWTKQIFVQSDL